MELKIVQHKTFKKIYFNFLAICLSVSALSILLYLKKFYLFGYIDWVGKAKYIFLFALIGLGAMFSWYHKSQREKLQKINDFQSKLELYETFYKNRLWWHVISCMATGFLLLITFHYFFIFFLILDLLSLAISYPSEPLIKRELNEDDIIFN
jgi:hypothetical protein